MGEPSKILTPEGYEGAIDNLVGCATYPPVPMQYSKDVLRADRAALVELVKDLAGPLAESLFSRSVYGEATCRDCYATLKNLAKGHGPNCMSVDGGELLERAKAVADG